ncbi:MAG: DUF2309 domain-containing protein [Candidatus Dependentiae bacterium]|nr:DUF2309 domain-containing protein [Candidatus Dependentiae bacterium]
MQDSKISLLDKAIEQSWSKIPPLWPLSNFIAVNPLQGLEDLPFEKAMTEASIYFQQNDFPDELNTVNRQTIKWMQAFFDKGQATVAMPLRPNGLYLSLHALMQFDQELFLDNAESQQWLKSLPLDPKDVIFNILHRLNIPENEHADFLTLSLTTLPGWASYIRYLSRWSTNVNTETDHPLERDYLAIRLIFIYLLWPNALSLLDWHTSKKTLIKNSDTYNNMVIAEQKYQAALLQKLQKELNSIDSKTSSSQVQMIFCIDVRSEPFRKAIESVGSYETLGFAGFFGLPVHIEKFETSESYDSCPVLLASKSNVQEAPCDLTRIKLFKSAQKLYQSMKYTFTVPFVLAEALGVFMGAAMALKTLTPNSLSFLQKNLLNIDDQSVKTCLDIQSISFKDQCEYAETVLKMLALTKNFKNLIIFCGHGSSSENNAYSSALDCGACGAKPGGINARILAMILNSSTVREHLKLKNIDIPSETIFLGAQHNTTTDELFLYESDIVGFEKLNNLKQLKADLVLARKKNNLFRARSMGYLGKDINAAEYIKDHSQDWAQVRPEWGLAGNASFIIAPRDLTKNINLAGRSFLHSYDYKNDPEGLFLTTILTAPMIVAQWINYQYLFSTIDNVAYGSGSKITQNITGKFGVMQGNASDLMFGLPLQSVYTSDRNSYHEPVRLQVFVYAPQASLDKIVSANTLLQKLFGNGWVVLICIEPIEHSFYVLNRNFSWKKINE